MKKTLAVVVLLLVVISFVTVVDWRKTVHLQDQVEVRRDVATCPSHSERVTQTNAVAWRQEVPLIDPTRKIEIQKTFDEIVVAFSNRQVKVMGERFAKVAGMMRGKLRGDLDSAVYAAFARELDHKGLARGKRVLHEFKGVDDFCRYAESVLEMARILGDLELEVMNGSLTRLEFVDFLPLYFFERYREKYQCEKRPDLEASVRDYIEICHARIDADDGYLHTAMRRHCQVNMKLVKEGRVSRNDMLCAARGWVMGTYLTFTNYKPKWLETEFPLPAGYKPGGDGKGACLE